MAIEHISGEKFRELLRSQIKATGNRERLEV